MTPAGSDVPAPPSRPEATASFAAFGAPPVTVHGDDPMVAHLRRLWALFVVPDPPDAVAVPVPDLATASAEVNRTLVARSPHPAVHAGVVVVGTGALAFPAVSGAGKSTLTTALCRAGAGYLSDEALVLAARDDGATPVALPYPKPVALSRWSADAVGLGSDAPEGDLLDDGSRELLFGPDRLGGTASGTVVSHLLLPERAPGPPRLEPVRRSEGLAALVRLSFNHYRDPARFLVVAAAVVNGAQVSRLQVGDPTDTARLVLDTLG